jgi:hypothetical protein
VRDTLPSTSMFPTCGQSCIRYCVTGCISANRELHERTPEEIAQVANAHRTSYYELFLHDVHPDGLRSPWVTVSGIQNSGDDWSMDRCCGDFNSSRKATASLIGDDPHRCRTRSRYWAISSHRRTTAAPHRLGHSSKFLTGCWTSWKPLMRMVGVICLPHTDYART